MKLNIAFTVFLLFTICSCNNYFLPWKNIQGCDSSVALREYALLEMKEVDESSGLIRSRKYDNVFWTHNDSFGKPELYPFYGNGKYAGPCSSGDCAGVRIRGAENKDWEDITADNNGNLIIADSGNNWNRRKDLAVYIVKEPAPNQRITNERASRIPFFYPEQLKKKSGKRNFDSEAIFWARGKLYLLTKHRSDEFTCLYRFDSLDPKRANPLKLISCFDIGGMVTGADAAPDGRSIAVLTYESVWLFTVSGDSDDYLAGKKYRMLITAQQCEGICFFGDSLILTNEQRKMFKIPLEVLKKNEIRQ